MILDNHGIAIIPPINFIGLKVGEYFKFLDIDKNRGYWRYGFLNGGLNEIFLYKVSERECFIGTSKIFEIYSELERAIISDQWYKINDKLYKICSLLMTITV